MGSALHAEKLASILRPNIFRAIECTVRIVLGFWIVLSPASYLLTQPTKKPEPRERAHTPHQGWYDIVREKNRLSFFTFSRDGFRIQLWLYRAPRPTAPLVLLIPDVYQQEPVGLQALIDQMQPEAHVLIAFPRGQQPRARKFDGQKPEYARLTRTLKASQLYWRDYSAALNRVRELQEALRIKPERKCVLAGDFHSNVLLQDKAIGLDCVILLSPEKRFYQRDMAKLIHKENKLPVLILTNPYQAPQTREIQALLPGAKVLIGQRSGSGLQLLHRNADLRQALIDFLKGKEIQTSPDDNSKASPAQKDSNSRE